MCRNTQRLSVRCAYLACAKAGRGFLREERGSVALISALVLMLLIVGGAFALDLTRASASKETLQQALDVAALAAAQESDAKDSEARGQKTLAANLKDQPALLGVAAAFKSDKDAVNAEATATVDPIFLGLPMKGPFKVTARTEVKRAVNPLELALVLDTTGSMAAGTRMPTLKSAATKLVNELKKNSDGDVRIAVIPFAQYVNVGAARRVESWVNVGADYSKFTAGACTTKTISSEQVCKTSVKTTCTQKKDGITSSYSCNVCTAYETKTYSPPKTTTSCTNDKTTYYKFFGCVGSPAYPKNVEDKDPFRSYPGFLTTGSTCGAEITPLTSHHGSVISAINTLSPNGETYIPAGLAWGFNALSTAKPLTEAAAYDPTHNNRRPRKALVLMTDGENTLVMNSNGTHGSPGSGKTAAQADAYTAELCKNIKAEKIELFTIAFEVTNVAAKSMLETCATDSSHYFDASNSAALMKAFEDIAGKLRELYISK